MHECTEKGSIEKILDRVNDLEKSKERTDVLVETFIETTKELSKTMKKVEATMINMSNSLRNNEDKIGDLSTKVDELKVAEQKNKIDIRDMIKNNIIKGGVGALGLYGFYELVIQATK